MILKNMFKKTGRDMESSRKGSRPEAPQGILRKCNKCGGIIIAEEVKSGDYTCPKCHGYFRVPAYRRIEMIADEGSFEEWDQDMEFQNPLAFRGYEEKVNKLKNITGLREAIVTGKANIGGYPAVIGVCDGRFLMASMGRVVGEKITRAVERAAEKKLPLILFACSGGARMQEGIVSLMQMAKTSAALKRHSDAGGLYISVLTDPTTGGVTASFAMLGDIILAEPKALIGFAGPRVIEQTIGEKLPKGFQRSEFLLEHGFIDRIVEREDLKETLTQILSMHRKEEAADRSKEQNNAGDKLDSDTESMAAVKYPAADEKIADHGESGESAAGRKGIANKPATRKAWDRVLCSRKKDRPVGEDYIRALFDNFLEFHGDRYYKDDKAIVGGIARFHGKAVTVIAQAKGKTTKDNIAHNFGMPSPDGYRKALRLMKQAEKFGRPIFCFVDTPGAFCGLEAEERGQGEAIARNLYEMSSLKAPILSIIIGEGGSGGALAMAAANEVWMLENSIYSILSPEGFASILWKDSKRADEAAEVMKLTAEDLKKLGMVEQIIEEPEEYTCANMGEVCRDMENRMDAFLNQYGAMEEAERIRRRYERFRSM